MVRMGSEVAGRGSIFDFFGAIFWPEDGSYPGVKNQKSSGTTAGTRHGTIASFQTVSARTSSAGALILTVSNVVI